MTRRRSVADFSSAYPLGTSSATAGDVACGTSCITATLTTDCTDLQFHFGNFHGDGNGPTAEIVPPRPIRVRASVQLAGPTVRPCAFNGSRDVTIAPGNLSPTDPFPGPFPRSTRLQIRTLVETEPGGTHPLATLTRDTDTEGFAPGEDRTRADDGDPKWPIVSAKVYGPALVTGIVVDDFASPAIAGLGDSIMEGLGDLPGRSSFFTRALGQRFGQILLAKASARTDDFLGERILHRLPLLGTGDWAFNMLGINDVGQGIELAVIIENNLRIGEMCRATGVRAILSTLLPFVREDGSFDAPSTQTPAAFESIRLAYNAWVREGAPVSRGLNGQAALRPADHRGRRATARAGDADHPYAAVIDLGSVVEVDATNAPSVIGGRWRADARGPLTYDGTHLTTLGHATVGRGLARALDALMLKFHRTN